MFNLLNLRSLAKSLKKKLFDHKKASEYDSMLLCNLRLQGYAFQ